MTCTLSLSWCSWNTRFDSISIDREIYEDPVSQCLHAKCQPNESKHFCCLHDKWTNMMVIASIASVNYIRTMIKNALLSKIGNGIVLVLLWLSVKQKHEINESPWYLNLNLFKRSKLKATRWITSVWVSLRCVDMITVQCYETYPSCNR